MFSSESIEWGTPQALFNERDQLFHFELDVCASDANHKCAAYLTQEDDAFVAPWLANEVMLTDQIWVRPALAAWMNPPYCRMEKKCNPAKCKRKRCVKRGFHTEVYVPGLYQWVELAHRKSIEGTLVDCLLPGKTGSRWWRDFVWDNERSCVKDDVRLFCIPGRLIFEGAKDSAPFDSVLVTFLPQ